MSYTRTKSDWPDENASGQYEHFLRLHGVIGPTIDATPKRGKKISEWTFKETCCALFALAVIGIVGPFVILIGGLSMLAVWDAMIH